SRRRHTRCLSDWSSDVCSSDLFDVRERAAFFGCAHAEKRGTFTNVKGRVQRFMKAVEPRGEARPEWEFLHELVYNVTGRNGFLKIGRASCRERGWCREARSAGQ